MTRLPDWRRRLAVYLNQSAAEPFEPGKADCALFAAGCIEAMTGTDPAAEFRGRYSTLEGGFKRLMKAGFADLETMAEALLEEVPVAYARVGDLAVLDSAEGPALGIVQGARIYVRSEWRLATVSLLEARRVFRV